MQTYNGLTLEQIKNNLPPNMAEVHKRQYLDNCKQVIKNEASGFNLDYNEALRNYNFNLILFYNAT
jgi:hypothetical protein